MIDFIKVSAQYLFYKFCMRFTKKNTQDELELLEFFENKIKKMDSNTKNKLFGVLKNEQLKEILDLDLREKIILYPLIIVVFLIGFFPNIFIDPMSLTIDGIILNYEIANDK